MKERLAVVAILLLGITATARTAQAPAIDDVVRTAGAYLDEYIRALTGVVSVETYRQTLRRESASSVGAAIARQLHSEVALVSVPGLGWRSFRDVHAVDGELLPDRTDRLLALFVRDGPADPVAQAERITKESTRYNLDGFGTVVTRTINYPTAALRFLEREHQWRSTFTLDGMTSLDGTRVAVVEFVEQAEPRLIASADGAPAYGRFWIDPVGGRVLRTELRFDTTGADGASTVRTLVEVRFADVPAVGLWLPVRMDELYQIRPPSGRGVQLTTRADYTEFRTFEVRTDIVVKKDE